MNRGDDRFVFARGVGAGLLATAGLTLVLNRWSVGSANAAVLPVPVWAQPIRSRPAITGGIACSWIGVAVS